jgi:hypothetical protein
MGRMLLNVVVLVVAYGVGRASDAVLNEDPCMASYVREDDDYAVLHRWFPPRSDCLVTTPSGEARVDRGSSEVFLAMFGLTLVVALAFFATMALAMRVAAVVAGCAAAFLVIFIV